MRILVTLDGSHFSEAILGTVINLASPLGAEVELFTVGRPESAHETRSMHTHEAMAPLATSTGTPLDVPLPSVQMAPPAETREQALQRAEAELRGYLQSRASELNGVKTTITVDIAADPAPVIIEHARTGHADLIAMATHGRSGLSHLLAGSVCERVIRSGVAPVVVLRP
jgi:nucleotide-binding universal stress UspA family protein